MARKHRLKIHADNPFTKLTGKPVIKLTGMSNCTVVNGKTLFMQKEVGKQAPTKLVAAYLYLLHPEILESFSITPLLPTDSYNQYSLSLSDIKVEQTCGVDQCVNPSHLEVSIKSDINYGWGI